MVTTEDIDEHINYIREGQTRDVDEHLRDAFDLGAKNEVQFLINLGATTNTREPEPGQALDDLAELTKEKLSWYRTALRDGVVGGIDSDGFSESIETLANLFDDGLVIDRTGDTEELKWVNPDGSSEVREKEAFFSLELTPAPYYEWVAAAALREARHIGRVAVQLESDDVMGHMWMDPMGEESTPMAARLHGETFGRDGLPFYPPITQKGESYILPVFPADSPIGNVLPTAEELVDQRERWFVNYSKMRQGELTGPQWTEMPVDLSEHNVEFLYRQYLTRDLDQYLPN